MIFLLGAVISALAYSVDQAHNKNYIPDMIAALLWVGLILILTITIINCLP